MLPTGLAAESFAPGDGARFRKQFALPADRPLLLYVGRVAFEKNIDFLLRISCGCSRAGLMRCS